MTARGARLAVAGALLAACAFACGCRTRIEHNTSSIPEYTYRCSAYGGEAELDGKLKFSKVAQVETLVRVTPVVPDDDGRLSLKVTYLTGDGRPTVFGNANLGFDNILLSGDGKYTIKSGAGILKGLSDFFFEVPGHRLKKGDTWNTVRFHDEFFYLYGHKFEFQQPVEYKFTYAGNERLDGARCALIRAEGAHEESKVLDLPEGSMEFVTKLSRKGDIYFELKPGRVRKMTYDQVITYTALDAFSGEKAVEINNATRKVCEIVPR